MSGLGDLIEGVLTKFGVTSEKVEKALGVPSCGCSKRKQFLNELFPFARKNDEKKKKSTQNSSRKKLSPKTENQGDYIRDMVESHITVCCGPAGSGKTAVCVGLACEYLLDQKVNKIVVTRPVVESGNGLGYLPGGFDERFSPI